MAYNLHQFIQKYSPPLVRGSGPMHSFLKQYYEALWGDFRDCVSVGRSDFPLSFYQDLKNTVLPAIKGQYESLLHIIDLDQKRQRLDQRQEFYSLMDALWKHKALRECSISPEIPATMVRIRPGEGPFERKSLFHIPSSMRHLVSSQRFSTPGDPCLYLSLDPLSKTAYQDMLTLAWMESGMPKVFYASLFQAQEELTFLHLAKRGGDYLEEYDKAKTDRQKADRQEAIRQYLLTLPLRAACFIRVEDKYAKSNMHYYEEYMIPQLLMEWLQQSSYFDGLTYQSAAPVREIETNYAFNAVLPAKQFDLDGYDIKLKRAFQLSEPQKVSLFDTLMEFDSKINQVVLYRKELEEKLRIYTAGEGHPYRHLLSVCDTFCSIHSALKSKADPSAALPFQHLDELCDISLLICKTIQNAETADAWVKAYKEDVSLDTPLAANDNQEILQRFIEINQIMQDAKSGIYPQLQGAGERYSYSRGIRPESPRPDAVSKPEYKFI